MFNLIIGAQGKKNLILIASAFIMIFLMMTFNTEGPDIGNYIYGYLHCKSGNSSFIEKGYNFVMRVSNSINLSFFSFRAVITFICLLLLHNTIKFYKANENCVISIYMCFLFFMDTIQFRNFVVEIIVIYSTRFLVEKRMFNSLKYIFCILIATIFHAVAPVYLVLLACKLVNSKKFYFAITLLSIISFLFFTINRSLLNDIVLFVTNLLGAKSEYSSTKTNFGFIPVVSLYYLILIILSLYCKKFKINGQKSVSIKMIRNIHAIMALALPLLLLNTNFYRIFRNLFLLSIMFFGYFINKTKNKNINTIVIVILNSLWWVIDIVLYNSFNIIIEPIFSGNLLYSYENLILILETLCVVGLLYIIYIALNSLNSIFSRRGINYHSVYRR